MFLIIFLGIFVVLVSTGFLYWFCSKEKTVKTVKLRKKKTVDEIGESDVEKFISNTRSNDVGQEDMDPDLQVNPIAAYNMMEQEKSQRQTKLKAKLEAKRKAKAQAAARRKKQLESGVRDRDKPAGAGFEAKTYRGGKHAFGKLGLGGQSKESAPSQNVMEVEIEVGGYLSRVDAIVQGANEKKSKEKRGRPAVRKLSGTSKKAALLGLAGGTSHGAKASITCGCSHPPGSTQTKTRASQVW